MKNNRARYIAKSLKFEFCSGIVVQFRDSEFVMSLRNYGIGLAITESETKIIIFLKYCFFLTLYKLNYSLN